MSKQKSAAKYQKLQYAELAQQMLCKAQHTKRSFWEEFMKTLTIVLASLLFVSLKLFAAEIGEQSQPNCKSHKQEGRASIEVKSEDKKEEVKKEEVKTIQR